MHSDKQPCSSVRTPCASALTLTPCGMVGWTGTWLMALLEPPTKAPSPILDPRVDCWQRADGLRRRLSGGSEHASSHIHTNAQENRPRTCVLTGTRGRGCVRTYTHTHRRNTQGSRKDLAMLHLLCWLGTMAYTNTTHSWSAPLRFSPLWWLVPETTMKRGGHWKAGSR